jgi:hypothetical protein
MNGSAKPLEITRKKTSRCNIDGSGNSEKRVFLEKSKPKYRML